MNASTTDSRAAFRATSTLTAVSDGVISIVVGTIFTLGLFTFMAHFEAGKPSRPVSTIENLPSASLPLEIPPPPVAQSESAPASEMITGIDVAASESPVQISLTVPILESLPVPPAPPARIQTSTLRSDFKPKMDVSSDFERVFQQTEVDQRPTVLANSAPFIPRDIHRGLRFLRVNLMMVVDAKGAPSNVRVLHSSGNEKFDALVVKCVQEEWEFSPAVKKGRKVKCLVQRSVTIRWDSSPFDS